MHILMYICTYVCSYTCMDGMYVRTYIPLTQQWIEGHSMDTYHICEDASTPYVYLNTYAQYVCTYVRSTLYVRTYVHSCPPIWCAVPTHLYTHIQCAVPTHLYTHIHIQCVVPTHSYTHTHTVRSTHTLVHTLTQ